MVKKDGLKILIMDDEKALAEIAAFMLEHIGYRAQITADGVEAIRIYLSEKDKGQPFDAVILDINVPGGMGGGETIKNLLNIDPGIKAIVSSGQWHHPIMSDFKRYGFSGALAKPYDLQSLKKELERVFCHPEPPSPGSPAHGTIFRPHQLN